MPCSLPNAATSARVLATRASKSACSVISATSSIEFLFHPTRDSDASPNDIRIGCAGMGDGSKFPAVGRVDNFYRGHRSTARLLTHPFSGDAGQHRPRDLYHVASP